MGFEDAFDSSLIDYSNDLEEQDIKYKKRCDIEKWIDLYTTSNTFTFFNLGTSKIKYKINSDFSIDVLSDCYIRPNFIEKELPDYIQFNIAYKNFGIANLKLSTLKGCPKIVKGEFSCHNNENLKNLIGGPEEVDLTYYCTNKRLTSLEGAPIKVNRFNFSNCPKLENLNYLPEAEQYFYAGIQFTDIEKLKQEFKFNK